MAELADEWPIYGKPGVRGRSCGDCKACCIQIPVESIGKKSNERCIKLTSRGCGIYADRPLDCRLWSCRWLFDPDTADLNRPDIGGYIVDPMPHEVLVNGHVAPVVQVWVDPRRRDAHRAPELRAYLQRLALQYRMATLVRWGSGEATAIIAPALNGTDEWSEPDTCTLSATVEAHEAEIAEARRRADVPTRPQV